MKNSVFKNKWSDLVRSKGWTMIPNALIFYQRKLQINSTELNVLLILISYWREEDKDPFPSKRNLAKIIGCDESTIRKNLQKLEEKGIIERRQRFINGRKTSNLYRLGNINQKLQDVMTHNYL